MIFYHHTIPAMLEMKFKAVPFCWKIRFRTVPDEASPSSNLSFYSLKTHLILLSLVLQQVLQSQLYLWCHFSGDSQKQLGPQSSRGQASSGWQMSCCDSRGTCPLCASTVVQN